MTALVQHQPVREARRGKVQRVRSYGKPSWDDDSCDSYDYSMSSYEAEQLERQQREQRYQQFMRLLAGKLDCPHARSRHRKRIPIYNAEIAKLTVQPGAALETQWGDMPTELMEIIASHLHPCDIGRLRGVSSGWRAAFWQERVVRASLRGCGPRVDEVLMVAMFKHSGSAWKQIRDQMDVSRPSWELRAAGIQSTTLWEPVLNSIEPWTEYVRMCTNDTVANICFAMVPFVEHFTLEQRAPEIYALGTLAC